MHEDRILTPAPSPAPRINGARVFGVRPGSPFLFKVPATGEAPLVYGAEGLPKGLVCDSTSGLITGVLENKATHRVRLKVKNPHGEDQKELRIEVGDTFCLTPPMGWNSWYCFSESVSQENVLGMARAMKAKGLVDHGWTYVNIDDCWQGLRGGPHQAIQGNERFPDMAGLCREIHALGLKAGIYSTPWMGSYAGFIGGTAPNAEGDYSAHMLPPEKRLQPHQVFGRYPAVTDGGVLNKFGHWFMDRDARQWAEWGFDYAKFDWKPNDVPNLERIVKSLRVAPRDIALSLSNNAPFENAADWSRLCSLYRTTKDIHDIWEELVEIGFSQDRWSPFVKPGHWPDPDMLQVGMLGKTNQQNREPVPTRLTPDEQFTQMSLWSILSAPLLLSCDIARLDAFTLSLLTNDEVLEVNQDALGRGAVRVKADGDTQIWTKELVGGNLAVGLFNLADKTRKIKTTFSEIGVAGNLRWRDLWRQKDLGSFQGSFEGEVNAHGAGFYKIFR